MIEFMNLWFWPFAIIGGVLAVLVGILVFVFWVWMIIDAARRNYRNHLEKIIWIIIIVFGSWIGALVYYFVIKINNSKGLAKK